MRVLEPYATRVDRGQLSFETFIVSPNLAHDGGVPWALMQRFAITKGYDSPRVVDAVAIAGLQATIGNRRRAVVLIDTGYDRDFSTLEPEAAIGYLRRLGVPFYVWRLGSAPGPREWPEATVIDDYGDLRRAVRDLREEMARQRVIWLDGDWDPGAARLSEGAPARIAGASG